MMTQDKISQFGVQISQNWPNFGNVYSSRVIKEQKRPKGCNF